MRLGATNGSGGPGAHERPSGRFDGEERGLPRAPVRGRPCPTGGGRWEGGRGGIIVGEHTSVSAGGGRASSGIYTCFTSLTCLTSGVRHVWSEALREESLAAGPRGARPGRPRVRERRCTKLAEFCWAQADRELPTPMALAREFVHPDAGCVIVPSSARTRGGPRAVGPPRVLLPIKSK